MSGPWRLYHFAVSDYVFSFCPAGNREAEEREADVGAASALGRDEGCVRGPSVSSVVQPFCWIETAASPDGPRSEGRL